jgi:hypothetical protein
VNGLELAIKIWKVNNLEGLLHGERKGNRQHQVEKRKHDAELQETGSQFIQELLGVFVGVKYMLPVLLPQEKGNARGTDRREQSGECDGGKHYPVDFGLDCLPLVRGLLLLHVLHLELH